MLATTAAAQAKKAAKKAAQPAAKAVRQTAQNEMSPSAKALFNDMLPNTQRVFVIDSTVVDKNRVLDAMPLPKAYGQFVAYDKFFGKHTGNSSAVFVNGFGNRCYYTEIGTDSISRLYMCNRLGDNWGKPVAIREINEQFTDISYPYMASDGQTLYFAGRAKSDEGLGQRDIYMAKYNADEGHFMQAENIGLPFNSAADDYAYIVADADGMAWFATTRRQPKGKACVYAFVPTEGRQNYSSYDIDHDRLLSLANLTRIRETWTTPELRDKALKRLNSLRSKADTSAGSAGSIAFAVNDATLYTSISQFRSDETRNAFVSLQKMQGELQALLGKTESMRTRYHYAPENSRETLASQILQLEQKEAALRTSIRNSEQQLRSKEQLLLKKK